MPPFLNATFKPDNGYSWGREKFKFEEVWNFAISLHGKFSFTKVGMFL